MELVREPAININHLSTASNIKLIFGSTRSALNHSNARTFGQCDLHGVLVADWTSEHCREVLLDYPDDTPTTTTHTVLTARMGDATLISIFHVDLLWHAGNYYQGDGMTFLGIQNCIPRRSLQNERRQRSVTR